MNKIEEAAKNYQPVRDYSFSQTDSDVQKAFIEGVYWEKDQHIISPEVENFAQILSEKEFPYGDFRGKDIGVNDERTGMALRGTFCEGFEQGVAYQKEQIKQGAKEYVNKEFKTPFSILYSLSDVLNAFEAGVKWYKSQLSVELFKNQRTLTEEEAKSLYDFFLKQLKTEPTKPNRL